MLTKVKRIRLEKGMTQGELAKTTNVSRQTIGLIEKGEYNPSLKLCIEICKSLGVTLNDLFWEED
ncbi:MULTISPECIES: helix-turn-helix transcriptional regulator [Bacillus]|uniref:helix-turn-helix transcriptional regulator n=1 Tax=Bacillus TaxID=1386 RepID=UPI000771976D|nr:MULTISPECIES: helix-turn-helix transcriptional regulator [Bacillus]OUA68162.1 transcriptional regulator [Bacillus thuringiensis serovar thailandensis]QXW42370.1 helix-turn-helix transcriptional regulator [Klebsiella grimontii]KAB7632905.1 helix-turn-helix transcriptional regulator [Bacillus sp. B4-WWTP-NA-D-NA-NA]KXI54729.1 XRE family transcriptional regulator [Bacillus cereus]MCU5385023.1 helix-turn-helix transcriptional regulator [Bacillus cereus]